MRSGFDGSGNTLLGACHSPRLHCLDGVDRTGAKRRDEASVVPGTGSNGIRGDSSDPERRPQGWQTRQNVTLNASSCRPLPGLEEEMSYFAVLKGYKCRTLSY